MAGLLGRVFDLDIYVLLFICFPFSEDDIYGVVFSKAGGWWAVHEESVSMYARVFCFLLCL